MFSQPYHKLLAWQTADRFVLMVYQATKGFPPEERYGVSSQLQRAAVSVPLNIAEGQARGTTKDFVRFLVMARGSLSECSYLLELCMKLGYLSDEKYRILEETRRDANYLLQRMIMALEGRLPQAPQAPAK